MNWKKTNDPRLQRTQCENTSNETPTLLNLKNSSLDLRLIRQQYTRVYVYKYVYILGYTRVRYGFLAFTLVRSPTPSRSRKTLRTKDRVGAG